MRPLSVLIVDEHLQVHGPLLARLRRYPDLRVELITGSRRQAVRETRRRRPDAVLLDVKMTRGDGIAICRSLTRASPGTAVLVLTSYLDPAEMEAAFAAGAQAYALKDLDTDALVDQIREMVGRKSPKEDDRNADDKAAQLAVGIGDGPGSRASPDRRRLRRGK